MGYIRKYYVFMVYRDFEKLHIIMSDKKKKKFTSLYR